MGPCLSLHTQIAVVAGREGCRAQGLLEIDLFITLDWGSLPPFPQGCWPGPFLSRAAGQFCILSHLISKAKGFQVESPARNKYFSSRPFRVVRHGTGCPYCCQKPS